MEIKTNIDAIRQKIDQAAQDCGRAADEIRLIAVSKRKPAQKIQNAIEAGQTDFGENYIQEAIEKIDFLGRDTACWHFIGHLQSNKAKFAVKYFDLIHTVDKVKLAKEINKQAAKTGKIQDILLQVNIAQEETKSGAQAEDVMTIVKEISQFDHVSVKGLMCMPPFFDDPEQARPYFKAVKQISLDIEKENMPTVSMTHLSMGMSNDFRVAVEEGATMVRVGTAIFGSRD